MRQETAVEDYIYQSSLKSSVDRLQDKGKDRCIYRKLCHQPDQWCKSTDLAV